MVDNSQAAEDNNYMRHKVSPKAIRDCGTMSFLFFSLIEIFTLQFLVIYKTVVVFIRPSRVRTVFQLRRTN